VISPITHHHQKVFAGFFFYSLTLGSIFPRLGELQLSMGIAEGALGIGLLGAALGTQITLMFLGPVAEKFVHGPTVIFGVPVIALGQIAATFAPGVPAFFACLFATGLAIGLIEIVLNLEADRAEHQLGRRVMSRSHAFWSFGFFTAGLIGAGMAQFHVPPALHLLVVDVVAAGLLWWALHDFTPAPARPQAASKGPRFVLPSLGILALVAYTLSAMLLEGAGFEWSVIYMRDVFTVEPFWRGLAFSLGALTQGLMRYFGDRFIDRFGPTRMASGLLTILGVGTTLVTFAPHPAVALVGFALAGMGHALAFPLAMSAAAQRTDRPAAVNVAAFAQMSFVIFLVAPPLLGFVAEHFGIRWSFGIGLPFIALSALFVSHLATNKDKSHGG
jgi:MFS family permease